jgi:CRP-like cAMP-binding protein
MAEQEEKQLISINDFCLLAEKLISKGYYDDAIVLYTSACKIFPDNVALRLNLLRVKELKRKSDILKEKNIDEHLRAKRQEQEQLAANFLSLAKIYMQRKAYIKAIAFLETAKELVPFSSEIRLMLGKIFYENFDLEKAIEELLFAKEIDPFNEEIYWLLAKIFYERKDYWKSLENFVDALVLCSDSDQSRKSYYNKQLKLVLTKTKSIEKKELNEYIQKRKAYFNKLANNINTKRDSYVSTQIENELDFIFSRLPKLHHEKQDLLNKAIQLKKFPLLSSLRDEECFQLAKVTSINNFPKDFCIFKEDDLTEDIYLIDSGEVRISKQTPYGEQILSIIKEGDYFGEMDFIDNMKCSADAYANTDCRLYCISKIGLEELFVSDKHIAIQFYWHFWKTLSQRIREANELLKSFFIECEKSGDKRMLTLSHAEPTAIDLEKKLSILKEKGLSSSELRLLATFSKEERYYRDQVIFREGDKGDKLFIILDGEARISKYIPGVGEEALAILSRGDFFGEMALIDNSPRSADAIAHSDSLTVLTIESEILHKILSRDAESSFQFLFILCKILSNRLREINLKIYQWRMMVGNFA